MQDTQFGFLIDGWLRTIRDLYYEQREHIAQFASEEEQVDRLCELNVIQQVANVSHTTIVQNAASWSAAVGARLHLWHPATLSLETSTLPSAAGRAIARAVSSASARAVLMSRAALLAWAARRWLACSGGQRAGKALLLHISHPSAWPFMLECGSVDSLAVGWAVTVARA